MENTSNGFLQVQAYTAEEALPIFKINVRISGGEETNRGADFSLMTDRNGETETVTLSTPKIAYSLSPNPEEQPYSKYDVEIYGDGYYPKRLAGVTVFPGIKSLLRVEMIPDASITRAVTPPSSAGSSVIYEKEELI